MRTDCGLDSPALYEREIATLATRHGHGAPASPLELSAPLIAAHAPETARRLAAEVSAGTYAFRPLAPRLAMIHGKMRVIHRVDALDAVVFAAVARVLAAAIDPQLGTHLHSYRAGHSQWTASRALLRYLREHARAHADPRARGLCVLRRDVRSYGERIAVADDSSLWPTLDALLGGRTFGVRDGFDRLLRQAFRPEVVQPDGSVRVPEVGVPTGLATQPVACNAYLLPLDRALLAIPGAFYARFGDDLIFAHPSPDVTEAAAAQLAANSRALGLELQPAKSLDLWLTRPGRPHPSAARYQPVSRVAYLGLDVGFDGARLRADKRRATLRALRARLAHTDALLRGAPLEERARALCAVVAAALEPRSPLPDRYSAWLGFDLMSREDLAQLDHLIALDVAQRLARARGVRAFRELPPRVLYTRYGLPSLVARYFEARRDARSRHSHRAPA